MVCVGERFGGLDCEINQSSTPNQKRLESALRDDDVKYRRHEVISGKNAHFLEKEITSRALSSSHSHCRSLQKLNSEYAQEVHKNTVPGAPTDSVGPISLLALARRKKSDLEKECGGQFGRRVTPKLGTHRFPSKN